MIIHRSGPESGFVTIPNTTVRDRRLSYQARGVLAELLSRPDDWDTTADAIWRRAKADRGKAGEGRYVLRSAFTELAKAGYLYRERRRAPRGQPGGGQFITVVHVFDDPELLEAWLTAGKFLAAPVDNSAAGDVSAGGTDDQTGSRRSGLHKDASPQVAPTTSPRDVGGPVARQPVARQPVVSTNTYDEDLTTETMNENPDEDHVGVLTSPVPVEGANGGSGQRRFSDEEWAERERIAARQVGPLPGAAP